MRDKIREERATRNEMFSERLRDLMMVEGIDQVTLAARVGVTKQAVSSWVNKVRFPPQPCLRAIAEALHTNVDVLTGADGKDAKSILAPKARTNTALYSLTAEEVAFLEAYKAASTEEQDFVWRGLGLGTPIRA